MNKVILVNKENELAVLQKLEQQGYNWMNYRDNTLVKPTKTIRGQEYYIKTSEIDKLLFWGPISGLDDEPGVVTGEMFLQT